MNFIRTLFCGIVFLCFYGAESPAETVRTRRGIVTRPAPASSSNPTKAQTNTGSANRSYRHPRAPRQKPIQAEYESCKGENLDLLHTSLADSAEQNAEDNIKTEAEFCVSCIDAGSNSTRAMKSAIDQALTQSFKEKLQKRVIGQIENKIFQTQALSACVKPDRGWFENRKVDWPIMKYVCEKRTQELRDSIKTRYPEMRVSLALSSPGRKEINITADQNTWLDAYPTSPVSNFDSPSPLNAQEQQEARTRYVQALTSLPLQDISKDELKEKLQSPRPIDITKHLSRRDFTQLKNGREKIRNENRDRYFEMVSEMPVLGYIKSPHPNDEELVQGFSKIKENLSEFLDKIKDPKVDMGLLLSFKPLVEELLKEDKSFCLTAEKANLQNKKNENLNNTLLIMAGVAAAVPCFMTGPLGTSLCIGAGVALGAVGWTEAQKAKNEAFGRALTGKEFETIAGVDKKEKDLLMAKLFFPMAFYGAGIAPARAVGKVITNAGGRAIRPLSNKRAYSSILDSKPPEEKKFLEEAIAGMELKGMTPAQIKQALQKAYNQCTIK